MALARPVGGDGEVERDDGAGLDQLGERRQGLAVAAVGVRDRVVALLRRTEGARDGGVVVEEREEDGDAFGDGCAQLRLDAHPVVVEPTLDGFELLTAVGVGQRTAVRRAVRRVRCADRRELLLDLFGSRDLHAVERRVHFEVDGLQLWCLVVVGRFDEQKLAGLEERLAFGDALREEVRVDGALVRRA